MCVLDVVDGVLGALLDGQCEVDVDRRVVRALHEVEARSVDADPGYQLVEQHDVAAPLRHALLLAVLDQMHHLVERDLEARRVVAERLRCRARRAA